MKGLIKNSKGGTMVFASLVMFISLCCLGLATDIGVILSVKSQLQNAVDAAALSGARGYIEDVELALSYAGSTFNANPIQRRHLQLRGEEVSFPTGNHVAVQCTRPATVYFLRIIGITTVDVSAGAVAMFGALRTTKGLKPWAVPDMEWNVGDPVVIKTGANDGSPLGSAQCWHYPVCFPPVNRGTPETGASAYVDNIINGSRYDIETGDQLLVEPGNMVGPTRGGVDEIIGLDADAHWNGNAVEGSRYSGSSSPRICKIPLIETSSITEDGGRIEVTVKRFGVFFIEGMQGQNLIGRYMYAATIGEMETNGNGDSDLYGVKLIG